jgi:hypothetical protein
MSASNKKPADQPGADQSDAATTERQKHLGINPLINENGDTSCVSAALDFVTWALTSGEGDQGEVRLIAGPAFGLAMILETCSAALKEMQ